MSGADRQWDLNRNNFEGCWQGPSHWYLRAEQHRTAPLVFDQPDRVIDDTRYAISFSDADTGVWDGSGLLYAPDGRRRLSLSRQGYNQSGSCWQFLGAGGQSSLAVAATAPRFGHEINFFSGRSRSMLVLLWDRQSEASTPPWRLCAVAAVAFRCTLSEPVEPPRASLSAEQLLAAVRGWSGSEESLLPGQWSEHDPEPQPTEPFNPPSFAAAGQAVALADRLVFAVPQELPARAFRLETGCLVTPLLFQQLSLCFDAEQRLVRIERRRFSPAGG